ncbi:hypothetical protein PWT90_06885 [Aphanocladium album]|nr:hypothetical protein PWT90_06885 [Aphanocladium album]
MEPAPSHEASRAYQLEMLDHSLRRNVIVAMDTGSGKTRVSILRIRAQLERSTNEKKIWFLAPTVLLCAQQYKAITAEISSMPTRLVTGHDNVDTWDASTWEALLNGTQTVVSTYQVLLDALVHAFVRLSNLSLLVFDEAHNATGNSPGGKIMSQFYHFENTRGGSTPAILGLTATPSIRADVKGLEALEILLDARCISPTLHRQQLLQHTSQPRLRAIRYRACASFIETPSLRSLQRECAGMDIMEDPHVTLLRAKNTERSRRELISTLEGQKTWSSDQINGFLRRAREVQRQLGSWAQDLYIWQVKTKFLRSLETAEKSPHSYISKERVYVASILRKMYAEEPTQSPVNLASMSEKVHLLLRELLTVQGYVMGIIFVKERVTADMLTKLLQSFTKLRDRYRFGCLVGTSNHQQRNRCLYEFPESANLDTLNDFRLQKINILVATSVLEEGIDVPACNLVICFDGPPTSKSFIQRRGRARMQKSDLLLLLDSDVTEIQRWSTLESQLAKLCQDSDRKKKEREVLESTQESMSLVFRVPDTEARLDQDNAKQHLEHFCQKVAAGEFIDHRPEFITECIDDALGCRVKAEVRLPTCLPANLRKFSSASAWVSEKNAMKDAAFQAVVALYRAGLVNRHLLPFEVAKVPGEEPRAAVVSVEPVYQPWHDIAVAWDQAQLHWKYRISLHGPNPDLFAEYSLTLPVRLWPLPHVFVHLDHDTAYQVRFSAPEAMSTTQSESISDDTSTLLAVHFAHRWAPKDASHVIKISADEPIAIEAIGKHPIDSTCIDVTSKRYLIRDTFLSPGIYVETLPSKPPIDMVQRPFPRYEEAPEERYLHLSKWTRRADFLHRPQMNPNSSGQVPSSKPYSRVLPVSYAKVDSIDIKHARFGMLIPSIMHHVEALLTAKKLSETLLQPLEISNLALLLEAITFRRVNKSMNYERLEFIGDSILKYCVSVQATAAHLHWPEGYLSSYKDGLVANSRLSRAAIEAGLSQFILATPFTGKNWRPLHKADFLDRSSSPSARELSTKVLADVVEALIGASYMCGGMPKVIQLLTIFINDCSWMNPRQGRNLLFQASTLSIAPNAFLAPLESLIRYTFRRKSLLLEGVTHASYLADTKQRSQGRLEFLGDAILDFIVVTNLSNHVPPLPHHTMHMIKTAMVNKDFLAFLTLEEYEHADPKGQNTNTVTAHRLLALWQFLRHASSSLSSAQSETHKRHQEIRQDILQAIHHGKLYPWSLLLRLQARKFFSDLFESILGAIWVDCDSTAECEAFLTRFGMMPYLMRILRDSVHVQHPKEELTKLACAEKVVYNVDQVLARDGEASFRCTVLVGDRQLVEVDGGLSREEVQTKAASAAVALLKHSSQVLPL